MKDNIKSVQFLRFVAAALVVCDHLASALLKYFPATSSSQLMYITGFGACGVHIFFVISGFVMMYTSFSVHGEGFNWQDFISRRAIRIYPIYWVYASIYIIARYLLGTPYSLSPWQFVGAYLLLPNEAANIIGPGWTLSFEVYFYICFSIAMSFGLRAGMKLLFVFFLASTLAGVLLRPSSDAALHVFTNSLLLEFLAGMFIGYLVISKRRVIRSASMTMIVVGLVLFLVGIVVGYQRLPSALMWGIPSALIVGGAVFQEVSGRAPSLVRRLAWLGDSSYSLYLLHVLVIDSVLVTLVNAHVNIASGHSFYFWFAGLVGVTVIFCIAPYQFIELQIVRRLQRLAKSRRTPVLQADAAQ
jgi:exopolysaccharide production protein ExoZ